MYSPDGTNWTIVEPPFYNQWFGICWSPELHLFVATAVSGDTNKIIVSNDGINWNASNFSTNISWRNVCWSKELGIFVTVSSSSSSSTNTERIAISSDGLNWQLISNFYSDNRTIYSVNWSSELKVFCAVGANLVIYSFDGRNWFPCTVNANTQLLNSVWAPELGIFCAVSFGTTRGCVVSDSKLRPPTSYNVFNSPFNSIDQNGNWSIQQVLKGATTTNSGVTPNVDGLNLYSIANTVSTTITNLTGGTSNQKLLIYFENSNTTIDSNSNILLQGGADFIGSQYDTLTLIYTGTKWIELCRSVNA
jgi:hypothetical protein